MFCGGIVFVCISVIINVIKAGIYVFSVQRATGKHPSSPGNTPVHREKEFYPVDPGARGPRDPRAQGPRGPGAQVNGVKGPPSQGLIIISIIIIVMIVKLLIISSISTISVIHICNMNDINNNIVRIYHNGGAILVSA